MRNIQCLESYISDAFQFHSIIMLLQFEKIIIELQFRTPVIITLFSLKNPV
jgi:hypothetical protein